MHCGAYYDTKTYPHNFKIIRFRKSYLEDLQCKNCGSPDIAVEIEVVHETDSSQE